MGSRNFASAVARRIVPAALLFGFGGAVAPVHAQSEGTQTAAPDASAPAPVLTAPAESVTIPILPIAPPQPEDPAPAAAENPVARPPEPEPAAPPPEAAAATPPPESTPVTVAAPAEPTAVFDAPGMAGVRMMAPIPDGTTKPDGTTRIAPETAPRITASRIGGKSIPLPRPRPENYSQAQTASALAATPPAAASPGVPAAPSVAVAKPAPRQLVAIAKISATKHANMRQSFAAANKGDWTKARAFATRTADPVFNALVQWRYLVESGTAAPFEEINSFLQGHPNWPRREALLSAAERSMPVFADPALTVRWYGGRPPATATGKIRLGEALVATGEKDRGDDLIRKGWIEGSFTIADETQVLQAHQDILSQTDHRARLQQLLARDDSISARRQQTRVDADAQLLANARLKINASPALAKSVFDGLPDSLKSDPELRFDTARALRRRGQDMNAWTMLADTPPVPVAAAIADQRWTERHIMARDAMRDGNYEIAYRLVSNHGMESGAGFADAEFLAGWIALRFLNKPELALGHFRTLTDGVMLPISMARGNYWLGRAHQELGQMAEAASCYRKAAESSETFYGQLALARIEDKPAISFSEPADTPSRDELAAFAADERTAAIRLLADLGDRDRMRLFAIRVANDTPNAAHIELLAELMIALNDPAMSVRVAKLASYGGIVIPSRLAPTMPIPRFPGQGVAPDSALVLGLARQESEFDPKAISSAGARGLMQIMPATARRAAASHGLAYRLGDLTGKPQYNMQLGMATISDFLGQWTGSYVLAIASYNAGAGNVTRWIERNGDPRDPMVDPVDWIELIPFGETRNYVQRVLENVQVYRSRLSGSSGLYILTDLYRPLPPMAAVLAYDPPPVPVEAPAVPPPTPPDSSSEAGSPTDAP